MAFAITVNDDACHTLTFSKNILAYQSEASVSVTVTVPAGVKALGNFAWLDFILPDGTEVYKGHYDPSGGSFIVTLGATDTILDLDGKVGIQFVLRDALDSPTVVWRSETKYTKIGTSINATVHATSGVPASTTFPDLFPAEHTSIADAGNYYAGATAEDALQEVGTDLDALAAADTDLAGAGRTTETVKANADAIAVHETRIDNIEATRLANKIINGGFQINQRGVSGTVTLAAGAYGHDRWKAGASGCTYTFANVENVTTLTISAGSLVQVIEGLNLRSGTHCLTWTGTAQGRIGAGSLSASGVTGSATGGTNLSIEFGMGTLSKVMLTEGSQPIAFITEDYDEVLRKCRRYCQLLTSPPGQGNLYEAVGIGVASAATDAWILRVLDVPMRVPPTELVFSGNMRVHSGSVTRAMTNLVIGDYTSTSLVSLFAVVSGGLTQNSSYALGRNNTTSAYVLVGAEL